MKKLFTLMVVAATMCFAAGCDDYDDSDIKNRLDDIEERVDALEKLCANLNTNIESLKTLVEAQNGGDYITAVTPVTENGEVVGYTIVFAENDPITIYNGKDGENGENGENGYTPQIGVKQDTDGVYYWTVDGEWLTDDLGNKVQAEGQNGTTPQIKIENGGWWVSTNGSDWTYLGSATSDGGSAGTGILVTEDDENVTFTLSDGTVIVVAKRAALEMVIEGVEGTEWFVYGETKTYAVTESEVTKAVCTKPDGWKVAYADGVLTVTAPAAGAASSEVNGEVSLIYFGAGNQASISTIDVAVSFSLATEKLSFASTDVVVVAAQPGEYALNIVEKEVYDSYAGDAEFIEAVKSANTSLVKGDTTKTYTLTAETEYYAYAYYVDADGNASGFTKIGFTAPEKPVLNPEISFTQISTEQATATVTWNANSTVAGAKYLLETGGDEEWLSDLKTYGGLKTNIIDNMYAKQIDLAGTSFTITYDVFYFIAAVPYDEYGNYGDAVLVSGTETAPEMADYDEYLGVWEIDVNSLQNLGEGNVISEDKTLYLQIGQNVEGESYEVYGWSDDETIEEDMIPWIWTYEDGMLNLVSSWNLGDYTSDVLTNCTVGVVGYMYSPSTNMKVAANNAPDTVIATCVLSDDGATMTLNAIDVEHSKYTYYGKMNMIGWQPYIVRNGTSTVGAIKTITIKSFTLRRWGMGDIGLLNK